MGSTGQLTFAHQRERPGEGHPWTGDLKKYASTPGSHIIHFEEARGWPGNYKMDVNKTTMDSQLLASTKTFNHSNFVGVQAAQGYYTNIVAPKLAQARDPEIRGQFPGALGTLPKENIKLSPADYRCYPTRVGPPRDFDKSILTGMKRPKYQKYWWHPPAVDTYAGRKKKVQDRYI
mmetsp:Transcript_70867/g.224362  ORF Transcript_70867/g.224362 Transcript_70867/m.224362 type:complete len:176 (+) Transcript_70867:175-702(+)